MDTKILTHTHNALRVIFKFSTKIGEILFYFNERISSLNTVNSNPPLRFFLFGNTLLYSEIFSTIESGWVPKF